MHSISVSARFAGVFALVVCACGAIGAGALPASYRQVEYLGGDGSAYIDLGVTLSQADCVTCDFYLSSTDNQMIYGSRTSSSANNSYMFGVNGGVAYLDFCNTGKGRISFTPTSYVDMRLTAYCSATNRYVRKAETGDNVASSATSVADGFTTPANAYLFLASGGPYNSNKFKGRIYSFTSVTNGILRMDLVPCVRRSDQVVGLYDRVGGTFLANAGSGAFTAPAVFVVESVPDQPVTGEPVCPVLTVSNSSGGTLVLGTDYRVEYANNTWAGQATATIIGLGDYDGFTCVVPFHVRASRQGISSDYVPVEYIQGNGVDTRFVTDVTPAPSTDSIETEFELTSTDRSGALWCSRGKTATTSTWTLFSVANVGLRFDYNASTAGAFGGDVQTGVRYTLAATNNAVTWSGGAGYSYTAASFTAGNKLTLFAAYYDGLEKNLGSFATHRMYSFVLRRNGAILRDYRPCYRASDLAVGLYDAEKDTFLASSGSKPSLKGDATAASFRIEPVGETCYENGSPQTPSVIVRDKATGAKLTEGVDYDLAFTNNVCAGRAQVRVTGKGDYAGMDFTDFTIWRVVRSKGGADPAAKGTSWADAATFTNALYFASTSTVPVEVWVAGVQTQGVAKAVTFASETVVRGGFAGTETLPTQRASGTRATVNANGTARALNFSNGATAPVTVERMIFTNGKIHNVERSGAGDVTFRDCDFTCCAGGTMYDGNGAGNANRNRGGSGASFTGTSPSVLTVERCHFGGNTASGEWVSSGVGAWVSGFKSATFCDTLFATNCHNSGRAGCFAAVMQVNNVPTRFTRCAFRGNYSYAQNSVGDFLHLNGNCGGTVFENCEITGNYSAQGPFITAALGAAAQTIAITNCTFAYNYMGGNAEVRCTTGALTVHNSIFHRNHCASALGFGVDVYVSGATSSGIIDWTYFDALSATYYSNSSDSSLVTRDCVTGYDPLFVTSTEAFATLTGTTATPVTSKFNGTRQQLASFDVHLLSSEGYYDATGGVHQAADVLSGAVDGGDPADPVGLEKSGKNGNRINLGAYGGTQYASLTPLCEPSVENLSVTFDPQYTQPTITFTPGGTGVYSGSAVIKVSTNGTDWCYVSVTLTGLAKGTAFSHRVPMYFKPGDALKVSVELSGGGTTVSDSANDVAVVGVLPPWAGKGGGANVLHVRPGATGLGTGANWTDALGTVTEAIAARTAAITEIWFAGTNVYASGPATYSFATPFAIRGGFTGAENTAAERRKGARSVLDAAGKGRVLKISNSADVVLDGLVLTRGTIHDLEASGAGNLTLTNCAVTCCAGGTMYDGNSSGSANRNLGGAGLSLTGTGSATLTVVDSEIGGNTGGGEWVSSGVGGWITGYTAATFADTLFATNSHSGGRNGTFATVLQVNGVPVRFTRCAFRGNYSSGGDFLCLSGNCGGTVFENCEVTGNYSSGGPFLTAALGAAAQTVAITNCTFAYNYMGGNAEVRCTMGALTVHNSIFHRNHCAAGLGVGVDVHVAGASSSGLIDWTFFDALSATYYSQSSDSSLVTRDCATGYDPLFVTSTEAFATLTGTGATPATSKFNGTRQQLASFDVHLLSSEGYFDATGGLHQAEEDVISGAIDGGDPLDDTRDEVSGKNGWRINLGAYGGTRYASWTPYCMPAVEGLEIAFDPVYTQPTVSFVPGGEGSYSGSAVVRISTNGTDWCYVSEAMSGLAKGSRVSYRVPVYFLPGSQLTVRIDLSGGGFDVSQTSDPTSVVGKLPPWFGKGGGANVLHVRTGATGRGTGANWTDALGTVSEAIAARTAAITEIWFAGTNVYASGPATYSFATPFAIRGGFTGAENKTSERRKGARSVLDAAGKGRVLKISASADVVLDGLVLTRGTIHNVEAGGAGNLTLTNCAVTCCAGGTMYDGNSSGSANRNLGGAGLSLTGTGSATLTVVDSEISGNTGGGEWVSSGVGGWITGYTAATFADTLFATNSHSGGRNGTFATVLQVNGVPVRFTRCAFRGNYSSGGDFLYLSGNSGGTVFENCEVTGNYSSGGPFVTVALGGVADRVNFRNCTFAYNFCGSRSSMQVEKGTADVKDTIFFGNVVNANATRGADVYLNTLGRADIAWTSFAEGDFTNYVTAVSNDWLSVSNVARFDPLFVTSAADFKTAFKVSSLPRSAATFPKQSVAVALNVHLRGTVGYVDETTGERIRFRQDRSPAIDAGDPADDWSREPDLQFGYHGRRVNLGAYGNTPWATLTPLSGAILRIR